MGEMASGKPKPTNGDKRELMAGGKTEAHRRREERTRGQEGKPKPTNGDKRELRAGGKTEAHRRREERTRGREEDEEEGMLASVGMENYWMRSLVERVLPPTCQVMM